MWQSWLRNYMLRTAAEHVRTQQAGGQGTQTGPDAASSAGPAAAGPDAAGPDAAGPDAAVPPRPASPPVCDVGMVFALSIESGGMVDRLSGVLRVQGDGFVAREGGFNGRRVVLVEGGVGRTAAQRAAEALIAGHRPKWILSAGFAGGLAAGLRQGDILMPDQIIDPVGKRLAIDFKIDPQTLATTPGLHVGPLLTVDSIVRRADDKRALGKKYGALGVDMESSSVAEVCRESRVRFLSVRVISDTVDRELPADVDHLVRQKSTLGRLGAASGAIFRRPSSVKDLWRLKEDAIAASDRLAKFLIGIVPQLD